MTEVPGGGKAHRLEEVGLGLIWQPKRGQDEERRDNEKRPSNVT
jgi:hypothetical protein